MDDSIPGLKFLYKLTERDVGRVQVAAHLRNQTVSAYVRSALYEYLREHPVGKIRLITEVQADDPPLPPVPLPEDVHRQLDELSDTKLIKGNTSLWILKADDWQLIKDTAKDQGLSVSELIRQAVRIRLERDRIP